MHEMSAEVFSGTESGADAIPYARNKKNTAKKKRIKKQ
jgi:hypothetical protein